jgi:hypothetical protein
MMNIWQIDFYRRPLQNELREPLWELLVCTSDGTLQAQVVCPQAEANAAWLQTQLDLIAQAHGQWPIVVQAFRPQTVRLLEMALPVQGTSLQPTRRVPELKQWLQQRSQEYRQQSNYTGEAYNPLVIEQPPPRPLPENLWGDRWRFAALPAGDLEQTFTQRLIPILDLPAMLLPLHLGLASSWLVPGIVIDAGRRSMRLARWLQENQPIAVHFVTGTPDGLVLEADLCDRWVVATFEDAEVRSAAQTFEQRKQAVNGLHFLLVEPDDTGMTYTGFWLLQAPA